MNKHLALCAPAHDRSSGKSSQLFQVRAEDWNAPMFWIDIELKGESLLRRLDDLLRHVWLECCGHLSAFTIGDVRYAVLADLEFPFERNDRMGVCGYTG